LRRSLPARTFVMVCREIPDVCSNWADVSCRSSSHCCSRVCGTDEVVPFPPFFGLRPLCMLVLTPNDVVRGSYLDMWPLLCQNCYTSRLI
jgi:hypothetical protein